MIKPIGDYFPQAPDGTILNPCSPDHIPVTWQPGITYLASLFQRFLGDRLHSVYLRGSIVRGMPEASILDIDSYALVHDLEPRWSEPAWANDFRVRLGQNAPLLPPAECYIASWPQVQSGQNAALAMVLQTQSLCILGTPVQAQLPSYRPGPAMMTQHHWLAEDNAWFRKAEEITQDQFRSYLKLLIRSAFELVMERVGAYTPDLYLCCTNFIHFYPKQETKIWFCLESFLNPPADWLTKREPYLEMGEWLEAAFTE